MAALILLHALASVAAWLRGVVAAKDRDDERLLAPGQARRRKQPTLSPWQIGWEILKRNRPPASDEGPPVPPMWLEFVA